MDAYLEDVFNGKVQEIRLQPSVSSNVVTYNAIINAPNDDLKLMPGMTANVTIFTAENDHALLLPVKALKFRPDSSMLKDYYIKSAVGRGQRPKKDTTGKTFQSEPKIGTSNYVWVLKGDTLEQRHIRTGLNDNTHIEVLKGLTTNDIVVLGVNAPGTPAATGSSGSSPFMPRMGGGRRR